VADGSGVGVSVRVGVGVEVAVGVIVGVMVGVRVGGGVDVGAGEVASKLQAVRARPAPRTRILVRIRRNMVLSPFPWMIMRYCRQPMPTRQATHSLRYLAPVSTLTFGEQKRETLSQKRL